MPCGRGCVKHMTLRGDKASLTGAPVIPLGTWLGQRGIELDADGIVMNDGTVKGLVSEFGALCVPNGGRRRHRWAVTAPLSCFTLPFEPDRVT